MSVYAFIYKLYILCLCIFHDNQKVLEVDTREAQRLGLFRPLVGREIEKHFANFVLEPDFVSHSTIGGLSDGPKAKIVLGAVTWRRPQTPHIMCLDGPIPMFFSLCRQSGVVRWIGMILPALSLRNH